MPDSQSREPGFRILPLLPFRRLGIFVSRHGAPVHSAVNEYLAVDGFGNVSVVFARIWCMARMLHKEVEFVSG